MKKALHARLDGRYLQMKHNLTLNQVHITNQGLNFLRSRFGDWDNVITESELE